MPPVSRFGKNNSHAGEKADGAGEVGPFFERFFGLI